MREALLCFESKNLARRSEIKKKEEEIYQVDECPGVSTGAGER